MNDSTTRQRSTGAAHIGYWIRGTRPPLLAPEDGGGGGGASTAAAGGTSPTTTTPTPAPAPAASPAGTAPAGSEPLLPQSRVNEIAAQARREGRESALRELQASQAQRPTSSASGTAGTPAAAGTPAPATPLTEEGVIALMARERAFTLAAASLRLEPSQAQRMEHAFRADKPADVTAWVQSYAQDMRFTPIAAATTATATPTSSPSPEAGRPATAPSSPARVDPITAGGLVDIWNLSLEQLNQLGPEGLRAEHEKILAAANRRSGAPPLPRVLQRK